MSPIRRILLWTTAPLPAWRGDSMHILELAGALSERGYEVHLVGELSQPAGYYTQEYPRLRFHQVRYLRGFWQVYQLIRSHRIELVHSYVYCFSEAGLLGAKLAGVPMVAEIGDDPISCYFESRPEWKRYWGTWNERLADYWLKLLLQAADGVASLSRHLLDWYRPRYSLPECSDVFPQAANLDRFYPREAEQFRRDLGFAPENQIVHFIGTSAYLHGCHVLVESIPRVLAQLPEVRFVFTIGSPAARAEVEQQIAKLGLAPGLAITQSLPGEQLALMHCASDLCLAPHINECSRPLGCSPKKVSEYMGCGRAVLCSDIPELREFGGDACAYFRAGDSGSLAEEIVSLLGDPERRQQLGAAALHRARRYYSAQTRIDRLVDFYSRLKVKPAGWLWMAQWAALQFYRYWRGR